MARIMNYEIPNGKNSWISLTYIYGIGKSTSEKIHQETGINKYKKNQDWTEAEKEVLSKKIKEFCIGEELSEKKQKIIDEEVILGTRRGKRLVRKPNPLPVNGQRSRHNARTAKKGGAKTRKVVAVAGKKKLQLLNKLNFWENGWYITD